MDAARTRLRFSEEELEAFISNLWLVLEKHNLPSPNLRFFNAAAGGTTVELCFASSGDLRRALRSLTSAGRVSANV